MCATCGCSNNTKATITNLETNQTVSLGDRESTHDHSHDHHHGNAKSHHHDHAHTHLHEHGSGTTIRLEEQILAKNNSLAKRNRDWLDKRNILAVNLVSSPGSGKTTLLERTIRDLATEIEISVVEGDQETVNDARRIRNTGCKVTQINTGTGCHLEADMLQIGLTQLAPLTNSLVMIENVGNLVCPALFDLGERHKAVVLSVTEGEDKPSKYPHMFQASDIMILNKIDLLPYLQFDVDRCIEYAHLVNPDIKVFQLSATSGEGLGRWYDWLRESMQPQLAEKTGS